MLVDKIEEKDKRKRLTAQERRELILARAKRVFARISYREASTKQLAQESDISEPMLYKHFGSKKQLFLAVLEQFGSRFTARWQHQLNLSAKSKPLRNEPFVPGPEPPWQRSGGAAGANRTAGRLIHILDYRMEG